MQIELLVLDSNTWNHLTFVQKRAHACFKNVTYKLFAHKSLVYYMHTGFGIK